MKLCVACGMPMEGDGDFPLGDRSKDYCVHCARPDGSMQSYEEKAQSLAAFVARSQGLDPGQARKAAEAMMGRLPAWKAAR
ncbi:MAG TPA: zinc ribbon domain-containing protein [Spirochaetales bacterium]|nr:zinc ribbon domain-containing protein [Spirochaetales bacterium]HRY54888.1 zinc ribbon domain-containing protein [Spirochaetia bacterium]HRZ66112.1 zinc ribbon domain-containing protein [Spirochaetia bacterium]